VLAYDYPLMGFFWSMFIFFLWVLWFMLLFQVLIDIFRSDDLGGGSKALWTIFVIILPFLGIFVYLIARGKSMTQRRMNEAISQRKAMDSYVRETAAGATTSAADELTKLAALKDQGILTEAEFAAKKAQLLATP
jgi:hypothetical protein